MSIYDEGGTHGQLPWAEGLRTDAEYNPAWGQTKEAYERDRAAYKAYKGTSAPVAPTPEAPAAPVQPAINPGGDKSPQAAAGGDVNGVPAAWVDFIKNNGPRLEQWLKWYKMLQGGGDGNAPPATPTQGNGTSRGLVPTQGGTVPLADAASASVVNGLTSALKGNGGLNAEKAQTRAARIGQLMLAQQKKRERMEAWSKQFPERTDRPGGLFNNMQEKIMTGPKEQRGTYNYDKTSGTWIRQGDGKPTSVGHDYEGPVTAGRGGGGSGETAAYGVGGPKKNVIAYPEGDEVYYAEANNRMPVRERGI